MRTLTGVVVLGILLLLGTSPGHATPHTFTATLDGASVNPLTFSLATGFATVILDDGLHTLDFNLTFSGLIGGPATVGTMHCCVAPSTNGPLAMPPFPGFPFATSGTYLHTFDTTLTSTFMSGFLGLNGGTAAGAEAALLLGMQAGEAYFNIHNSQFPAGEIRGNFAQVPEASTLLLLGSGLVGLAAWRLKRTA
jgi:hypothetical protein